MSESDPERRLAAIAELRRRWPGSEPAGQEEILAAFREALLDDKAEVRRKVLLAHGVTGVDRPATTDAILARLDDGVGEVRAAAAQILGRASTASAAKVITPALIAGFHDRWRHDVGAWSLAAIARRVGDQALGAAGRTVASTMVEALEAALEHDNGFVRQGAAMTLGRLGAAAVAARPSLIGSTRDPHEPTRFQSVLALGKLPQPGLDDLRCVLEASADESGRVRAMACHALARPASVAAVASSCAAEGLAALARGAEDRRDDVRSAAIRAVSELAPRLSTERRSMAVTILVGAVAGPAASGRVAGDGLVRLDHQLPKSEQLKLRETLRARLGDSISSGEPERSRRELRRLLKRLRNRHSTSPSKRASRPASTPSPSPVEPSSE